MITELRTLVAVARWGTFAAAGARIGLTQAAVSGHVRRLEEALGFALFERTGRSAWLNAEGLRTLERAQSILASFDALGEPAREAGEATLRVGAIASVHSTVLARALVAFRKRQPLGRVHVTAGVSVQLMDGVDAGALDLAILIRPSFSPPGDLAWTTLVEEDYALLVPAKQKGDDWRALLAAQPFIRYDRASSGGRQVDRFLRDEGVQPSDWLEIDDMQAMMTMVAHGAGASIVPMTEAIQKLPKTVRKVALPAQHLRREIGILRRTAAGTSAISDMVDCLLRAIPRS